MKKLMVTLFALASLSAGAHNVEPGSQQQEPILLKGGTLHTITQGTLVATDLLVQDGKIQAIGTHLEVPADTQVLDVTGKHVYPGLIALDTTLGIVELEQARPTDDLAEVGAFTPEVLAHHAYSADSEVIPTVRYMGITHAQVVPQGRFINGRSSLLHLDGWHWKDALVKAPLALHISWPRAGVSKAWWERRTPAEQKEASQKALEELKQTFIRARAYHEGKLAGTHQRTDQRYEAMRDLFTGELALFVHADDRREIEQVLEFQKEYGFQITLVGAQDSWMLADALAAAEIPVVYGHLYGQPGREDEGYDSSYATPSVLSKAGVTFALAYPGYWDSRNLPFAAGNAVAFGLDYQAALKAITLTPAQILGVDDELGSLDVGKQASLVVSSGDILNQTTHHIEYMLIEGRQVALTSKQLQLYEKYKQR